jgi:hypothetical protein
MAPLPWIYDDGGRQATGRRGVADDCVVRAIAIAAELDYGRVYDDLADLNLAYGNRSRSARDGVKPAAYRDYLTRHLGWIWTPTMRIGSGCTVHLDEAGIPDGRLVVRLSRHLTAVVEGIVHDTHDPGRDGTRCVYGYWRKP